MMLPNISPKLYSLSAVMVGYLLIEDMNYEEQNAIGNWLMLVAQLISTNAFYKEYDETKNNINTNEKTLVMLEKMIKALEKEVDSIKKEI